MSHSSVSVYVFNFIGAVYIGTTLAEEECQKEKDKTLVCLPCFLPREAFSHCLFVCSLQDFCSCPVCF